MKRTFVLIIGLALATPALSFAGGSNAHSAEGSGIDRMAEPSPGFLETLARKRYNKTNKRTFEATTGRTADVDVVTPPKASNSGHSPH